ncbi:DUF397 domain-containing protein [Streptomyces sp. NPDC085596]|uniref:DUF397 domain-containing protein n=1 Tax=Streptomyces sp. NPDC085596 TaxID=3365731 RepID=UPI0037D786E5
MSENLTTLKWFKSSHSGGTDGNSCVEVAPTPRLVHIRDSKHATGPQLALAHASWTASVNGQPPELTWFKSSHSGGTDGNSCVEVALAPRMVHIRDSKHTAGPQLILTQQTWTAFVTGVRD